MAEVTSAITAQARAENMACAQRLAAIGELYDRRQVPVRDTTGRELWRLDQWAAIAAEVAAALSITAAAAGAELHIAVCLRYRLPQIAALFATGALSYRLVRLIANRTLLALDPEILAGIDTELAATLAHTGALSLAKTETLIDTIVERHDPDARRRTQSRSRSRYVDFRHQDGLAAIIGDILSTDAVLLDHTLTSLAHTVCEHDPRTLDQRRADALGALAQGATTLRCACERPDCTTTDTSTASTGAGAVIVHVVADHGDLQAATAADTATLHGTQPGDGGPEYITDPARLQQIIAQAAAAAAESADAAESAAAEPAPEHPTDGPSDGPQTSRPQTRRTTPPAPPAAPEPARPPAGGQPSAGLVVGGPVIPAAMLADLLTRGIAELRPLIHPGDKPPEPGYRPSKALADYVRCRDMTCRFPGCDQPAYRCDIDHTIPHSTGGPTHASNLKCLCRHHHLLKSFWTGTSCVQGRGVRAGRSGGRVVAR